MLGLGVDLEGRILRLVALVVLHKVHRALGRQGLWKCIVGVRDRRWWLDLITDLGRDVTREEYLRVSIRRQRRANSAHTDIPEGLWQMKRNTRFPRA